jgi:hypothetical protein
MATQTSSLIGVSLTAADSTAQFALGTSVNGTDGTVFQYVFASNTMTTGKFVQILTGGTAITLSGPVAIAATAGLKLGVTQFLLNQGEYGFVATHGGPIYIACSGTVPPTVQVGYAAVSGVIITAGLAVAGATAAGVFITTSASTAGVSVATGIITYPRTAVVTGTPAS